MSYRIIIQPRAFDDLGETYSYLAKRYSIATAAAWYEGCIAAIDSLAERPLRCPLARESAKLGVEVRQLLYRRYSSVYRILFVVRDSAARVLSVRHSARDDIGLQDIGDQ